MKLIIEVEIADFDYDYSHGLKINIKYAEFFGAFGIGVRRVSDRSTDFLNVGKSSNTSIENMKSIEEFLSNEELVRKEIASVIEKRLSRALGLEGKSDEELQLISNVQSLIKVRNKKLKWKKIVKVETSKKIHNLYL